MRCDASRGCALRDVLQRIVRAKRADVARRRLACPLDATATARREPIRSFAAALGRDGLSLIAEFKRRSPSSGAIRIDADPALRAIDYQRGGAAAISVVTDREFFAGCDDDLIRARSASTLPVLRKEFIVDPYQIHETAALGADALLLIVRILDDRSLARAIRTTRELAIEPLVEVHDEHDLARAVDAGATIVGLNSRDLDTFRVDLSRTISLRATVPAGLIAVAESGVETAEDARRVREAGFDAVLVGEALMRADDPRQLIEAWTGRRMEPRRSWVKICGVTELDDALDAVRAGADAIGFVFARSPRRIEPARARRIIERLPADVRTVGVFVDESHDRLVRTVRESGVDMIQLHGDEPPSLCGRLTRPVIKRIRVGRTDDGETLLARMRRYDVAAFLLDPGAGNGRPFDWSIARRLGQRVVVAGGLSAANVPRALSGADPYGVDACSGVERYPGRKDPDKLHAFVRAVRQADERDRTR
ncbi:MAG TPA: indole-3-glycerol phosphate synthase TrpC [Candidatus Polarisedimenticolaceae bacterium]|nr:indole-3-glycerol phosphate synthase TrpC [Candidatus Polarisedimenticolaceae bacterium]